MEKSARASGVPFSGATDPGRKPSPTSGVSTAGGTTPGWVADGGATGDGTDGFEMLAT
jgi:hypothetical protein